MLTTREIEEFYRDAPFELLEIVLELRSLIFSVCPEVTEIIQWKGISYYVSQRGGPVSANLCQIFAAYGDAGKNRPLGMEPHVQLAFIHGAFLPDPTGILEGTTKSKRFVRIFSFTTAPWSALKALLEASVRYNPYSQSFRE